MNFLQGITTREFWLNPRSKASWTLGLILAYSLAGFFWIPVLIKDTLIEQVRIQLDRKLNIEKVSFNPYLLQVEIHGLALADVDQVNLLQVEHLLVNLQSSGLVRGAWTFSRISLTKPTFLYERFAEDDSRITRLFPAPTEVEESPAALPAVIIFDFELFDGHVNIVDRAPQRVVTTELGPISIALQNISTLPDSIATQQVRIALPSDGLVSWEGEVQLEPLKTQGYLTTQHISPELSIAYLESTFPLQKIEAFSSSRAHFDISQSAQGLRVRLDEIDMTFNEVHVEGLNPVVSFFRTSKITLSDGRMELPERRLFIGKLQVAKPELLLQLNSDGQLNLEQLNVTDATDTSSAPWQIDIDRIEVSHGLLTLDNQSITVPAVNKISLSEASILSFSTDPDHISTIDVTSANNFGDLMLKGKFSMAPSFDATVEVTDLQLSEFEPYINQYALVNVTDGLLNTHIEFSRHDQITARGNLSLDTLSITDRSDNSSLLRWKKMAIDDVDYQAQNGLRLGSVTFNELFAQLIIRQDQSTNLSQVLVPQPTQPQPEDGGADLAIAIESVRIIDGQTDFSDFSLPLPFRAFVSHLNGKLSGVSSNSLVKSSVALEGQVGEFGFSKVDGTLSLFDPTQTTDINVAFKNLSMQELTPYSVQFAGREIAAGKLDVSLNYMVNSGQLEGKHNIVMSSLELGEKIDHPDAANLPLGLAIALLKDADGVIDVNLPVQGDVNDPEFKLGGVIWKAFSGLIAKVATAPFRVLAGLIGNDSEKLGEIEFISGRSELIGPELEKIKLLAGALAQRPALGITIPALASAPLDGAVMRYTRLNAQVSETLGAEIDMSVAFMDPLVIDYMEQRYTEHSPSLPLAEFKARFTLTVEGMETGTINQTDYAQALRDQYLDTIQLAQLALTRQAAIATALSDTYHIPITRIELSQPELLTDLTDVTIAFPLGLYSLVE